MAICGTNLYAGVNIGDVGSGLGVFLSTDYGQSWVHTNLDNQFINALCALSVQGRQFVFAGTNSGVFMSSDAGISWLNTSITAVTTALTTDAKRVFAGTWNGVCYTTDAGSTWIQTAPDYGASVLAINGPNIFEANGYGVYRSTDNGATWLPSLIRSAGINSLAIKSNNVYAGTPDESVCVSTNNGVTWTNHIVAYNTMFPVTSLAMFVSTSGINQLLAGGRGLYISSDNGTSWTPINSLQSMAVQSLAVIGEGSETKIFAGTVDYGVFYSTDAGSNWTQSQLYDQDVVALGLYGSSILAANKSANLSLGVYISTNYGGLWRQTSIDQNETFVNAFDVKDSIIFAGGYRSTDGGLDWLQMQMHMGGCYSYLVKDSIIFAGGDARGTGEVGVAYSTDDGVSWIPTSLGNSHTVRALTSTSVGVFAGVAGYYEGVYVSTDDGQTWSTSLSNGEDIYSLASMDSTIFAGTGLFGIMVSSNNGLNWSQTSLNNRTVNCLITRTSGNVTYVFAGTDTSGVYLSTDKGASWAQINQGFGNDPWWSVKSFCITNGYIYAGTNGYSVWKRPLSDIIGIRNISDKIPGRFTLYQNYPNPFNPTTIIKFDILKDANITFEIYDILGRTVATLAKNEFKRAGSYQVEWNAGNFASGVYFCRITAGRFTETKKMVLLK